MPSVVVDSVLVEAGWDPSALERGLARSERLVQEFAGLHPAITLEVNGKEIEGLNARIKAIGKTPIVLPPIIVPPIVVPPTAALPPPVVPPIVVPPPDFTQTIAEATRAAAIVREEFEAALRGAATVMAADAFDAGILAGRELQAGLVGQIQGIGKQVAAGLISIPQATAQIDAAIQAMSVEAKRLQGAIPPIQIRTVVMPEGARGITTGASPSVIPAAELDEAERAFHRLQGVSEATHQTFLRVGSSSSKMAIGVRGAASNLSILAAQSVGATGAVGTLAQNVLLFSSGIPVVAAVAAGVLVLAKTYEFLNTKQREADERNQKLLAGLRQQVEVLSATAAATLGLAAAIEAEAKARQSLAAKVAKPVAKAFSIVTDPLATGIGIGVEIRRQQEESITKAIEEQRQARKNLGAAEVETLTQSLSLHVATAAQQARAVELVRVLQSQEHAVGVLKDGQLAVHIKINQLQEALNAGVQQEIALRAAQAAAEANRITALAAAPGLGTDTPASIRERATEMTRLNNIIHSGTASLSERNDAAEKFNALVAGAQVPLDRQRQQAQDIAEAQASAFHDVAQAFADALGVVQAAIDTLGEGAGEQFARLIKKQQDAAKEAAKNSNIQLPDTGISAGFDRAVDSVKDINDAFTRAAVASNKFFARARKDAEDLRTSAQEIADAFSDVSRAIGGLQSIGNQLGILDEQTNQLIDGLGEATQAVAQFASGDILGGIVSGLGALASIGQGLGIGKSADQKAAEQAIRENTQAIRANTVRLSEGFQGVGGAAEAANILRDVIASTLVDVRTGGVVVSAPAVGLTQAGGDLGRDARNAIVAAAAGLGLSFNDLQRLADEFGITILERGKLVGGSLEQLAQQIDNSIAAQLRFTQSFADQLQKQDLGSRLRGESQDATSNFAREIQAATNAGASAITDAFRGLGALGDTPAVRAALVDLFNRFTNNTLDPATLGNLSREDFLKFLNDGAGFLETFNDGIKDAAKSLGDLNVPQGFRRAAIAFQTGDTGPDVAQLTARTAAVAAMFPAAVPAVSTKVPEIKPLPDDAQALLDRIATKAPPDLLTAVQEITATIQAGRQTATAGDVNTAAPAAIFGGPKETRTTVTFEGGINVYISGEHADPNKMADDFFAALRRKALTQSGDTLQFGVR